MNVQSKNNNNGNIYTYIVIIIFIIGTIFFINELNNPQTNFGKDYLLYNKILKEYFKYENDIKFISTNINSNEYDKFTEALNTFKSMCESKSIQNIKNKKIHTTFYKNKLKDFANTNSTFKVFDELLECDYSKSELNESMKNLIELSSKYDNDFCNQNDIKLAISNFKNEKRNDPYYNLKKQHFKMYAESHPEFNDFLMKLEKC